jgi:hypothetical protein
MPISMSRKLKCATKGGKGIHSIHMTYLGEMPSTRRCIPAAPRSTRPSLQNSTAAPDRVERAPPNHRVLSPRCDLPLPAVGGRASR